MDMMSSACFDLEMPQSPNSMAQSRECLCADEDAVEDASEEGTTKGVESVFNTSSCFVLST